MCNCKQNSIENVVSLALKWAEMVGIIQSVYISGSGTFNYINIDYKDTIKSVKFLKNVYPDGRIIDL